MLMKLAAEDLCLSISNLLPHNDWNVLGEAKLGYTLQLTCGINTF